jgi:uncharacterized protein (DUF952 family)
MKVYKVMTACEAGRFILKKVFHGNAMDRHSGFIHLSETPEQARRIAAKYYPNSLNFLFHINADNFNYRQLRFEKSETSGETYPHLYTELKFSDVIDHDAF